MNGENLKDGDNLSTPERTGADRSADALAGNVGITVRPEELVRELGAVGFGFPEALANPAMGHHTAAQCPYRDCPGPHAVGPYRTDCPMCGKKKTIEYGVPCSACRYLWPGVPDPDAEVRLLRLAEVMEQPVTWLWPKYIAAGKLTLLIGDPDIGKSLFVCDLVARLTTGKPWPDGAPAAPVGNVLLLSSEDAPEDTLRPRIRVAGGDLFRVSIVDSVRDEQGHQRAVSLVKDVELLDFLVRDHWIRAIVIDPVMGFVGGKMNTGLDNAVREGLTPLARMAERRGCAVLGLMHMGKDRGRTALYRAMGSIAFVGVARSVLYIVRDDHGQRFLTRSKGNYLRDSEKRRALAFDTVEGAPGIPVLAWAKEPIEIDLDAMLSAKPDSKLSRAVTFLEGLFQERAEVLARGSEAFDAVLKTTIDEAAAAAGICDSTLERARKAAGIESERVSQRGGAPGEGAWYWIKRHRGTPS